MDLVGGIPTPPKNMKVSWDDDFQYMKTKNIPSRQQDFLMVRKST